jgi:hypothetical protein
VVGDAHAWRDRTRPIALLARVLVFPTPVERRVFGWHAVKQHAAARIGRRFATANNTIVTAARLA